MTTVHQARSQLDEKTLRQYVRDGYMHLAPTMPDGFHQELYQQVDEIFDADGNPGNNLLPRVPMIGEILDHPQVHGALTGILGGNYIVHAHRHCHFRPPHTDAQRLHKDSWSRRHHRTRWAMLFYYPQDTTQDMGPTGVVPGSQYYNGAPAQDGEVALAGEAGTVSIVHYDLWHRGMANTTDRKRYMLKFLFARMDEPEPSHRTETNGGQTNGFSESDSRSTMWRSMMGWHTGRGTDASDLSAAEATRLVGRLVPGDAIPGNSDTTEADAIQAAYALGNGGQAGHHALLQALTQSAGKDEATRRNIGYGLAAAGEFVGDDLCKALAHEDTGIRLTAIDALADAGVGGDQVASAMRGRLNDTDEEVQRRAAYAVGCLGPEGAQALPDLVSALQAEDEWLVRNASLAIARHGPSAADFVPQLQDSIHHPNRYVQSNVLEALRRIDTTASKMALVDTLSVSRWCPITTTKTPY